MTTKLLSATEAKKISTTNATRIAAKEAAETEKRRKAGILAAKNAKKNFIKKFDEDIAQHLEWAVKDGDKSTKVYIVTACSRHNDAQEAYDKHKFLPEIKAAMTRLRKAGYTVTQAVSSSCHTTQHESSVPDYDYYEYHCFIEIKWA